jgi:hypothetical protein
VKRVTLDFSAQFLVGQKLPNRDDDKNGQADSIADDAGFADFFLFDHAILLSVLQPRRCLVTLCRRED